jgi:hypothetical protein
MGEGFGDSLAAGFFLDAKPAEMKATVGNRDATAYSGDELGQMFIVSGGPAP